MALDILPIISFLLASNYTIEENFEQRCNSYGVRSVYDKGSCYIVSADLVHYEETVCEDLPNGHLAFVLGQRLTTVLANLMNSQPGSDEAWVGVQLFNHTQWSNGAWAWVNNDEIWKIPNNLTPWGQNDELDPDQSILFTAKYGLFNKGGTGKVFGATEDIKRKFICQYDDASVGPYVGAFPASRAVDSMVIEERHNISHAVTCAHVCRSVTVCRSFSHHPLEKHCQLNWAEAGELELEESVGHVTYDHCTK